MRVIVIEGGTGVGKTALGVHLAERFNGEIVGADSRQIYREMEIGTAKPTAEERARIPHHLLDLVTPDQTLTLTEYQALAVESLTAIHTRGKLPLLVGGTGQYITAVLEGWQAPEVAPNPALRAELEAFVAEMGYEALYARLTALDPGVIGLVDPRNLRRVIRALEVCIISGQPFSAQRRRDPPKWEVLEVCLTMDRAALDLRTDSRIDQMMDSGLLEEVRALLTHYDPKLPSMSGLGYAQLGDFIRGEITLEAAIQLFKADTRAFTRRQYTWFRKHGQPRWIDVTTTPTHAIINEVAAWLEESPHVPSA
jgi:tRNA dimethylallyltransferase